MSEDDPIMSQSGGRTKQIVVPYSLPAPSGRQIVLWSKVNCFLFVDLAWSVCKMFVPRLFGTSLLNIFSIFLLTSGHRSRLCHILAEWFPQFLNIPRFIENEIENAPKTCGRTKKCPEIGRVQGVMCLVHDLLPV
jgi:hypothetical protein